jgi:hypothetical protein
VDRSVYRNSSLTDGTSASNDDAISINMPGHIPGFVSKRDA